MNEGRTVKFRGKSLVDGAWVYGHLFNDEDRAWIIQPFGVMTKPNDVNGPAEYDTDIDWYEVDPGTVGQFVGLKDKNAVEVYSGMLLLDVTLGHKRIIGNIVWLNEVDESGLYSFGYYIQRGNAGRMVTMQMSPRMVADGEVADGFVQGKEES